MAITLSGATLDNEERVVELFRKLDDEEIAALKHGGGRLFVELVERIQRERAHHSALKEELAKARADAALFEQHVSWRKSALAKKPAITGSERLTLEDELKHYQAWLDGARDNAKAVEQELARG